MFILFDCPSGHRLKAQLRFEGTPVTCPACNRHTIVPRQHSENAISDSSVVRLLGDYEPVQDLKPAKKESTKSCPRCNTALLPTDRICSKCQMYQVI